MSTLALATLTSKLAKRLDLGDPTGLIDTLKATAFKGQVSDAQMTALMVIANQYGLNPWAKEIYAFPDKNNGIVPVVGVDGWSRIINNHPQFDGIEFQQDDQSCTCIIYRKDRSRPVKVTEYMAECRRANVGPWTTHPKRMLRHKAMIQCARLAFGYGGIYEADEAAQFVETVDASTGEITQRQTGSTPPPPPPRPELETYPQDRFDAKLPEWRNLVESGKKTPAAIINMLTSRATLTEAQRKAITDLGVTDVAATDIPTQHAASAAATDTHPADHADFLAGFGDD